MSQSTNPTTRKEPNKMMCYKDMTFCHGAGCKDFDGCPRAFTPEVQAAADKWWGTEGEAPICFFNDPTEVSCWVAPDPTDAAEPLTLNPES